MLLLFPYYVSFTELSEIATDGVDVIYWNVKYPFPLANRDVSFYLLVHLR